MLALALAVALTLRTAVTTPAASNSEPSSSAANASRCSASRVSISRASSALDRNGCGVGTGVGFACCSLGGLGPLPDAPMAEATPSPPSTMTADRIAATCSGPKLRRQPSEGDPATLRQPQPGDPDGAGSARSLRWSDGEDGHDQHRSMW